MIKKYFFYCVILFLSSNLSSASYNILYPTQTVTIQSGDVILSIPKGVLPKPCTIEIIEITASLSSDVLDANSFARSSANLKVVQDKAYSIRATDENGVNIVQLNGYLTLTILYSDNNNDGYVDGTYVDEKYLKIFYLCSSTRKWQLISRPDCVNNPSENTVSAKVNHFSKYALLGYAPAKNLISEIFNCPNPFSPYDGSTKILYTLSENTKVNIRIYNLIGDLVREMSFSSGEEGAIGTSEGYTNEVEWDGRNGKGMVVANGTYICVVRAKNNNGTEKVKYRKITVLK